MRRYFIITLAVLVSLCACTKNEIGVVSVRPEISFSVARYVGQTKADPADYAEEYGDVPFGTYAWFYQNGQKAQKFMVDETIFLDRESSQTPTWKPSITYYWPKSGTIDFISYSPKSISEYVTVTPESISFGDEYTVEAYTDVDVMYADKAVGCTANEFTYYYNGVPTLFRHALAKLNINLSTAYDSKVVKEGEDETHWVVTVTDISLEGIFNTGSLNLGLADDDSWTLPSDKVWDNDGNKIDQSFELPTDATINKDGKDFVEDFYVLPQTLTAGQTIVITVDIETLLPNGETIHESGVKVSGVLSEAAVKAWEMNKQISYDMIITPASGNPGDPDGQVAITFDPAVSDWEDVPETGTISL